MTLVVHPHFHPRRTGVTRHVESVVGWMHAHAERPQPGRAQPAFEARVIGSALSPELPRTTWTELRRRARTERVIWHAHRNNELLAGLALRALTPNVRVVFTRHSAGPPGAYTRALAARADARITLTEHGRGVFGLPSEVIPHGVALDRFTPPPSRDEAWAALHLPGRHGIGVVGRIRPEKGQRDFARAIAPLRAAHPEWTPVLIGAAKAPEAAFLRDVVSLAGGPLLAPGEQPDIARWYAGLSILVQPSHQESFSYAVAEALASGCCVVSSRLPPIEAMIDDGRTGFLYPPGDVDALRAVLSMLLADPGRVARTGAAGAASARERLGLEHEVAALGALYGRLTEGA